MGDSRKAISDDEDDYTALCMKYGETFGGGVYSEHHTWLEEKDRGTTTLSFEEYKFVNLRGKAGNRIGEIDKKMEELKKEREELVNFLTFKVKQN